VIDATRPPVEVFESLKASVARIFEPHPVPVVVNPRKSVQGIDTARIVKAGGRRS